MVFRKSGGARGPRAGAAGQDGARVGRGPLEADFNRLEPHRQRVQAGSVFHQADRGAAHVLNIKDEEFVAKIKAITQGRGAEGAF